MTTLLYILIPISLLAVLGILGAGIYSLGKGGDFAKKNSNKLMRLRVMGQAIAIALLLLFVWVNTQGG